MKKLHFLLLILFSVNGATAQWVLQNSGTTINLNSVYFTDTNTGWAVGESGTILHTSDGGLNWAPQSSNTFFDLKSVFFTDADHGYAIGNNFFSVAIILKTMDGGSTWTHSFYSNPDCHYGMKSVHFTDSSTGYIFGYEYSSSAFTNMFILKTVDSGTTWNLLSSFGGICIEGCAEGSMFVSSPDTAYIIHTETGLGSSSARLYITNDGWATSTSRSVGFRAALTSVFFTGATGYAIGYSRLYKSIDSGMSWTMLNGGGNSLFFTNANDGCIVGNAGKILSSSDGGANWATQNSSTTMNLKSVYFIDENTGYAVGDSGTIVKTTYGITGISELHQKGNVLDVYPNPTSTYVNIETSLKGHLAILNLNGQQLLEQEITMPMTTMDVSHLVNGIYVLEAVGENGVQVGKIIKQ